MSDFENIRPYSDEELHKYAKLLLEEKSFVGILQYFFKEKYVVYLEKLKSAKTIEEFQINFIKPVLEFIIKNSISELSFSGQENIPTDKPCLFISNHRDIVMDPALLDYVLNINGFQTAEIAIGDNLLIKPWIEMMVRLNRCFIVKRGLSGRDLLASSHQLSAFINDAICKKNNHVWIAQREGRAKDGNDRTHSGILRMLTMASDEKNLALALSKLNIVPVSISYEFDPCDFCKANELYLKSIGENPVKTPGDDLKNMELGIRENKGRVHLHFSQAFSSEFSSLADENPKTVLNDIISLIDGRIHKGMKIYPINMAAAKLFLPDKYKVDVDAKDIDFAKDYFKQKMEKYSLAPQVYDFLIEQYANPAINSFDNTLTCK